MSPNRSISSSPSHPNRAVPPRPLPSRPQIVPSDLELYRLVSSANTWKVITPDSDVLSSDLTLPSNLTLPSDLSGNPVSCPVVEVSVGRNCSRRNKGSSPGRTFLFILLSLFSPLSILQPSFVSFFHSLQRLCVATQFTLCESRPKVLLIT